LDKLSVQSCEGKNVVDAEEILLREVTGTAAMVPFHTEEHENFITNADSGVNTVFSTPI
jgi:hypothetical protein